MVASGCFTLIVKLRGSIPKSSTTILSFPKDIDGHLRSLFPILNAIANFAIRMAFAVGILL